MARRRCRRCTASSRRRSSCIASCWRTAARGCSARCRWARRMERIYQGLPLRELGGDAGFCRPTQPSSERVSLESPALAVMTDFTRATPATIRPQAPLAGANQFMVTRGVRLLLVVDEHEIVLGVLTANDLLGERSMLAATGRGARRDELSVADVMTPAERVEAVEVAQG